MWDNKYGEERFGRHSLHTVTCIVFYVPTLWDFIFLNLILAPKLTMQEVVPKYLFQIIPYVINIEFYLLAQTVNIYVRSGFLVPQTGKMGRLGKNIVELTTWNLTILSRGFLSNRKKKQLSKILRSSNY